MRARIYKYTLNIKDISSVSLPQTHTILSFQEQFGKLTFWAVVDIESPEILREFRIFGTGFDIEPEGLNYLATVQVGVMVWHIFEVNNF